MDFVPFPKLPRFSQTAIITEKVDGTNAQVVLEPSASANMDDPNIIAVVDGLIIRAGSRKRWITPGKATDNFGFASWVRDNAQELAKLGEGQHFGEWYGAGIQCGYGIDTKNFALFNTARWGVHNPNTPECCEVVPILHQGAVTTDAIERIMSDLKRTGSAIQPGYMNPEGIVIYFTQSRQMFKKTFQYDQGKWVA